MFKVLRVDGPNIVTDKGCVSVSRFQYADGGKTHPVSAEDWRAMRDGFLALPDLLAALEDMVAGYEDTLSRYGHSVGNVAQARAAIARARGK